MKVTSQLLENRQASLTIEVDDERVQKALQSAAKRLSGRLNIPGFRKGKAPYSVVLRAVGEEGLYEEAMDTLGQEVYREALEESQLDPYGPAQMDDVKLKPLVFQLTVPLRPTVDLGDYRALRVPYTPPEVTDEAVDELLKGLQERYAVLEPVSDSPAQEGHIAVLTIDGKFGSDENAAPFMHEHDLNLLIADATDFPFPGFVQNLVGMTVGEEKAFEMAVPETDEDAEMRGKTVYFQVKLDELKTRVIPPLDDAFAQTVGAFETLSALRDTARASLLQQAIRDAESKYTEDCLQKLVEQSQIEFPPQMVEEELGHLIERAEARLKEQKMTLDEFLNLKKQTREAYREELRPRAEANVKRGLVMSELAVAEGMRVSRDEVTVAVNMISAGYGDKADQVRESFASDEARQSLGISLLTDKVMGRLTSICKGENPPLPSDQEAPDETTSLAASEEPVEAAAPAASQAAPADAA